MTPKPDDPKWTAYALGELPPEERPEMEAALAGSVEARRFVEETCLAGQILEKGLRQEKGEGLTESQRGAIRARAQTPVRRSFLKLPGIRMLAAASLLVILAAGLLVPMASSVRMQSRSAAHRVCYMSGHSFLSDPDMAADPAVFNTEAYDHIEENPFQGALRNPLSTFSIDVDTASYANVRRFLREGNLPPKGAVRIEEFVNYFPYRYAPPADKHPFAVHVEVGGCPWQSSHRLIRVGLKGREIDLSHRPSSNLVFLIDVSGSMGDPNKLPLVVQSIQKLTRELGEGDRVAIAVYAGASGLVLPSTTCDARGREEILAALDRLQAGGSTNGGEGIRLAYETAAARFVQGGTNRVILATDGDFNVGVTSQDELIRLVEEKARTGVFLTVLGFGMGNYKDSTLEKLADKGNGNYAYIDTLGEARKVLVEQMAGTLITIAKDVKVQVEFNPAQVQAYRLIGYENRILRHEDFNNDTKDAGEIGAGHTVTALYEVVPPGVEIRLPEVDPLKYQKLSEPVAAGEELLTVKLRYKEPEGQESRLLSVPVMDEGIDFARSSEDFKFAASVAAFGMLLRDSPHKGNAAYGAILEWGGEGQGKDPEGYRREFLELVQTAERLQKTKR